MPDSDGFALGTFVDPEASAPIAGLVRGSRIAPLTPHLGDGTTVRGLVDCWDESFPRLVELDRSLAPTDFTESVENLVPLPPVLPVGQIFQAGANYRRHVLALMEAAAARGDDSDGLTADYRERARQQFEERLVSGNPFVFLGSAHAVSGAQDEIIIPSDCAQPDWELELVAVIGRRARRVSRTAALDHVAGYMIGNDVTSRDALMRPDAREMGIDWLAGKNSPTFLPLGPLFVPAVFVPDPMDLRIQLRLNGATMQDESTSEMVFGIPRLIEFISNVTEMRPGDIILTGSPAGNGASRGVFLTAGDVVEGEISGLGMQRNVCVAEGGIVESAAA